MKILVPALALLALSACSPDAPTPMTTPPAAQATAASNSSGIIECDLYLSRLTTCLEKSASTQDKEMIRYSLSQTRKKWAELSDRRLLAGQCKAMWESVRPKPGEPENCQF